MDFQKMFKKFEFLFEDSWITWLFWCRYGKRDRRENKKLSMLFGNSIYCFYRKIWAYYSETWEVLEYETLNLFSFYFQIRELQADSGCTGCAENTQRSSRRHASGHAGSGNGRETRLF